MEPKSHKLGSAVMDVVAPPAEKTADPPVDSADPLDQLAAQDQADRQSQINDETKKAAPKPPAKPAKPKPPRNGVGLAITATVIIVLGLAALATYAYLQTVR